MARRGFLCTVAAAFVLMGALAGADGRFAALGQEPAEKSKAAGVFDDEPKKTDDTKAADTAKPGAVTDRDTIGFTQENVASQMNELEERMFRLSEALRSLEPENASRLSLALKFSREELILHQMRDTHKLLKDAQLSKAETEVRQLLAKLEHLRSLLLAEDLDFQMKLARLRQMKETLGRLERIIKEEKRELAWSRSATEEQRELEKLKSRKADLAAIARDRNKIAERQELDRLAARIDEAEKATARPEFERFEKDQSKNRDSADLLAEASARLGDAGVSLQKDLIRASGSMRSAEGDLARTAAKPASDDQIEALKHLTKSRDDLARAMESLLVELRIELQARIVGELTEMHELQKDIRESTEAQAPKVAQKSRTALLLLAGLSQREGELAGRAEHLAALAEETEFGIALPTALHVLGKEMKRVQEWLKEGDASARTITLEKRVEQDLLALLEAMRRLPPTTPPPPGSPLPSEARARERELNRLIAELKMIHLLQTRLDDDTIEVDGSRPKKSTLTPELRREIESLTASQEEIRNSLAKIASQAEAGNEPDIPGGPERSGIPGDPGPSVIDR